MRLQTDRLLLRPWEERDRAPFAAINADPEVRRFYYPAVLDWAETDALIGGAGLSRPEPAALQAWPLEIGWILDRAVWGQGYASEISKAVFNHAWTALGATAVIGYTSAVNTPSRRAMVKSGMTEIADSAFEDDTVPVDHPLRPHVLYRIDRPD